MLLHCYWVDINKAAAFFWKSSVLSTLNLVILSTKVVKDYENTIVEGYKGIVSERFLVEVTSQIITALTAEDTVFQAKVCRRIGRTVIFFVAVLSYLS